MPELDRDARERLVADAAALQAQASSLLATREAARSAGADARQAIVSRTFPVSFPAAHDLMPEPATASPVVKGESRGRLLMLRPQDANLFSALLTAEPLDNLPESFDSWLERSSTSIPYAIPHAAPQWPTRRFFGRAPSTEARDRATADLMAHLALARTPQVQHDLERARPRDTHGTPLRPEHLRQATASALEVSADAIVVLPTHELQQLANALLAGAEHAHRAAAVESDARTAAEDMVDETASALLADVDIDQLRRMVSVGRFPSSALERAGITSVAGFLSRTDGWFRAIDGISPSTTSVLRAAARELQAQAREQAAIDVAGTSGSARRLRTALKAMIDHRFRDRGAEADSGLSLRMEELARTVAEETARPASSSPYPSGAGHAPAVIVGTDPDDARALLDAVRSFVHRQDARVAGNHLQEQERARLTSTADEDFTAHGSDYFALLTELGFEGHIAQNTHGDLPARLIEQVEREDLDTELLTLESLRRYQHFAARFIVRQQRVIIGDEMGLGKTIEALAAIAHFTRSDHRHTLVICPAAVVANWIRETESKTSIPAYRLHGAERDSAAARWQEKGGVAVTTFETLGRLMESGRFAQLDTVVVDEAHKIKNPEAKRTQYSVAQLQRASHAILMTGTPIENRVEEFRTLISYLDPRLARSAEGLLPMTFRKHIAPAYLRRNQDDVLKELPELNEIESWTEFSDADRREYVSAVAAGNFMAMRYAAMASGRDSNKVERLIEIVEDAEANGRKVIVFSCFTSVSDSLAELLPAQIFGLISGAVSPMQRQEIVDQFSNAPGGGVLLSQIQAGGEGLNIQAASVVVICEPQIKPSLETQAIARAHRMGQKRSVQVHRLMSDEGVDPRVVELLAAKTRTFDVYARESAAKDSDREAVEAGEVAIGRRLVTEEQARILGDRSASPL